MTNRPLPPASGATAKLARTLTAFSVLMISACGGGDGGGSTGTAPPGVLSAADYFVYDQMVTPSIPAGAPAIRRNHTRYYKVVNAEAMSRS